MKKVINLLLFTLFYMGNMVACVLTIHNDSQVKVTLVPHGQDLNDEKEIVNIQPGETAKFGKEHEQADFFLYMGLRNGNSAKISRVQQKACLHGIQEQDKILKVSELRDQGKLSPKLADFFVVTKLEDYPIYAGRPLLKPGQKTSTGLVPPLQMPGDKFEPYLNQPFNK